MRDFDRALADFDEAIRLDSSRPFYWANAALVRRLKGDYEKALDNCSHAIRLDPRYASTYNV